MGTLKRAKANVVIAKVFSEDESDYDDLVTKMSRGVKIVADCPMTEDILDEHFDAIVLPGGLKGAEIFSNNEILINLLKKHNKQGKIWGAICATPAVALEPNGLLKGD